VKRFQRQKSCLFTETPANPNMRLVDIAAVAEIAHISSAHVVVDTYMPLRDAANQTWRRTSFCILRRNILAGTAMC
jgi:O-acetylhomoserine/O-acetylserine sulfhydrylase-like pyridoxal-dependent enzyme